MDLNQSTDFEMEEKNENPEELTHKREIRKMLEARLEQKRLKAELKDELMDDYNWNDTD